MYIKIAQKNDYKDFIGFQKKLYKGDKNYIDFQSRFLKSLLYKKSCILNNSTTLPIMVMENDSILGVAMLATIDRMSDTLQICFLDFVDDKDVFKMIFDYAKEYARKIGANKILIGMNLHINYGLGLLSSGYHIRQDLGSSYNPKYYIDIIEKFAKASEELVSYKGLVSDIDLSLPPKLKERINSKFQVKKADFKNLDRTAKIYSFINNNSFKEHKYYFQRYEYEDLELFKDFKMLLNEDNLLFVFHNDEPVGFLLWYPDFNQLVSCGKEIGISTVLKYRLGFNNIDTVILSEFGIIPKYRQKGALYPLLERCYQVTKDKYKYVKSGWIMQDNLNSKFVSNRFIKNEYKKFKVFEILV